MGLEISIKDAPRQDLEQFKEYVYRIRIELRHDVTLEEYRQQKSIVSQADIRFLEFDLPASVVVPGCKENWQKAMRVMELKRTPVESTIYLVRAAIAFGVLSKKDVRAWEPGKRLALTGAIDIDASVV